MEAAQEKGEQKISSFKIEWKMDLNHSVAVKKKKSGAILGTYFAFKSLWFEETKRCWLLKKNKNKTKQKKPIQPGSIDGC
jgi:hypothetical protein